MGTTVTKKRAARKLRIAMTPLGKGVFAGRRFTAEELIGKIRGEVIHDVDYTSDYCMELTDTSVLEPRGAYRYLNHSCNPNCELVIFDTSDEGSSGRSKSSAAPPASPQLWLQTTRAIALGEELTIDYAWPADAAIPCGCSTANCRGWVVDESELAEVQRRQARQQRERARAEKARSTGLANGRADKASTHGQSQGNGSKLKRKQLAEKVAQEAKPKNAKASPRKLIEKTGRNISKLTGSSAVAARPAASARAVAPLNPPRSGLRKTHTAHALAPEHLTRSRTARSSR